MTTDIEILEQFYSLINVTGVTSIISGEVWTVVKPVGRELEDVVINTLTNNESNNNRLNVGVININVFTKEKADHRPDGVKIKSFLSAISLALLIDEDSGKGSQVQLNYKVESQKTFRDNDNPLMYFSNIRLNFSHKN